MLLTLKDVELETEDAKRIFEKITEYISVLYNRAQLVHADLSEFNILYDEGEPVIIDMGQSVTLDHPMARTVSGARYSQRGSLL